MSKRSCTAEDDLPSSSKKKKLCDEKKTATEQVLDQSIKKKKLCNEKKTATEQVLDQLINLFPQDKLLKMYRLPKIVMKHMVYS